MSTLPPIERVSIAARARKLIAASPLGKQDDRARERLRRVFLTACAALVSRVGTLAVLLVTVPLALHHLGAERFGIWMILSSLAAISSFADFGIGNGVLNLVATASGNDDNAAIREASSTALLILGGIGLAIATVSGIAYAAFDWGSLLGARSVLARAESGPAVLAFLLCLAAGLPLGLASKVQIGLQQGYAANLWAGVGGLLSLVGVYAAILLDGGTPMMVLALFGGQQLAMLLNYLFFFHVTRRDLAPGIDAVRPELARSLFGTGSAFFLLQLIAVIAYRTDALIISRFFGPAEAGTYALYERMFSLVTMIVMVVLMPLWPAYGEAISRGDMAWVRATFRRSVMFGLGLTAAVCLPLILLYEPLVWLWVGKVRPAPLILIVGLAVWKLLEAYGASLAALLNGIGAVRAQVVPAIAMCIVGIALKLLGAQHFGIWSVVWGTSIAYLFCAAIPLTLMTRRLLDQHLGRAAPAPVR